MTTLEIAELEATEAGVYDPTARAHFKLGFVRGHAHAWSVVTFLTSIIFAATVLAALAFRML